MLLATPWTVALQAPLSTGFASQEYWSGLPFPSPGDLPNQGIEPALPAVGGRFFTTEPSRKPLHTNRIAKTGRKENNLVIPRIVMDAKQLSLSHVIDGKGEMEKWNSCSGKYFGSFI